MMTVEATSRKTDTKSIITLLKAAQLTQDDFRNYRVAQVWLSKETPFLVISVTEKAVRQSTAGRFSEEEIENMINQGHDWLLVTPHDVEPCSEEQWKKIREGLDDSTEA
jgi:hypothetical protein